MPRQDFEDLELGDLLHGGEQPGSQAAYWVELELKRREHLALLEGVEAQKDAASYIKQQVHYMLITAIIIGVSSVATLLVQLYRG
jgi:hypothetical protein